MRFQFTDTIHRFFQLHKYSLFLVLLILGILYPISLFIYIPKWDNINGYLPYRYFVSDYLWNGHLPLWNPFQRFGYPGYADLQSGCWYPVVWFIMLFGKYNITSLIVELLLTYLIAGLGMYKLSSYIHQCKKTAFILGLSYGLSGFMVGSSQLMVFLIGVAWLPWCILALLQFFNSLHYKYIFASAVFVSLQVTGASPAFTIILAYIFVGMFVYFFWTNKSSFYTVKKGVFGGFILIGTMLLLLLPYIQSFLEFSPYFNRGDKLQYQSFLIQNPFVFADYISFLFPYSVISDCDWFKITDLSLRNGYIGLVGLFGFIFSILQYKNRNNYFFPLLFCIVISLVFALGDEFFIYKYLYHLPGFGLFRHPSFFRGYAMFCMLILAGFSIKKIISTKVLSKSEKSIFWGFVGLTIVLIFYAFTKTSLAQIQETFSQIISLQEFSKTSFYSHLFINLISILAVGLIVYLLKTILKLSLFTTLVLFLVLDLGVQTQLSAPTTIHYKFTYDKVNNFFNSLPNGIDQRFNHEPFKALNDTQGLMGVEGLWLNMATFNKCISSVAYNPIGFANLDKAEQSGALNRVLENELLYFPTKEFHPNDSLQKGLIWGVPTKAQIFEGGSSLDSVLVGYNEFLANVKNDASIPQWLILNQNYHHLWKAYYNQKELKISKVNEMVMGVEIPKNSVGKITFEYKSPFLIYSALVSIISYLIILYLWFLSTRKSVVEQNQNNK